MPKWLVPLFLLSSIVFGFNHPEINWKSVSTKHFTINFYESTEPSVYATWKIAEEAYSVLSELYGYQLRDKISISLADYDDFSNGWADWTAANIMIWIPDSRFDLRSNTTWLRNVIIHELTHILSLQSKKKLQMIDIVVNLSLNTRDETYEIQEPFARVNTIPSWLAEGIAQFETEALGHDCWDSRREMVLRSAVMENRLLSIDEMGHFNHDASGSEMVYNQGFSFCKHIARRTGAEGLRMIFREGAAGVVNIPSLIAKQAGLPLELLYKEWVDSLKDHFSSRIPLEPTPDRVVWNRGKFNLSPKISFNGKYIAWFTSHKDDGSRTDLILKEHGKTDPVVRISYAHTALCFSPESDILYFVKSRSPNKDGSYLNDIYSYDLKSKKQERLSKDARVYDMAAMPGGKEMLCIRYHNSVFSIEMLNLSNGTFTNIVAGVKGEPFMNLGFNPADLSIAVVSGIINGQSRIFRLSLKTGEMEPVTPGFAQEETPFWSSDGRIYFSADYNGVFNIYSVLPDGSDLLLHSNSTGGFFSPQKGPDGAITCSKYSASGFSIVNISPIAVPYEPPQQYKCSFQALPVPKGKVTIKARPYEAQGLRALWELQLFGQFYRKNSLLTGQYRYDHDFTDYVFGGNLVKSQSDALQKKSSIKGIGLGIVGLMENSSANSSAYIQNFNISALDREPLYRHTSPLKQSLKQRVSSVMNPGQELFPGTKLNAIAQASDPDQDSSSGGSLSLYPVVFPALGFENRSASVTTGLMLDAQMPMFVPDYISGLTYAQWHPARDLHAGIDMHVISFLTLNKNDSTPEIHLASEFPVSVDWTRIGYYNEDINFNYGDVTSLKFTAGPAFMPAWNIDTGGDTSLVIPKGLIAGLEFIHGFPLWKYGALQVFNYDMVNYHNLKVLDEVGNIEGQSRTYIKTQTGTRAVFPIVRNINREAVYYWDALYGNIGYVFTIQMNGEFFDSLQYYGTALATDPYYSKNAAVGQFITAGLELGHYKSYLFFKRLAVDFNYEILRSIFHISLSAGF